MGAWLERLSGVMFENLTAPDDQLCTPAIKHVATEVDVIALLGWMQSGLEGHRTTICN